MSQKEVMQRWLIYNARGKGKQAFNGGRYSYHGQILYSHYWPVARLIRGASKDYYVCLTKSGVHPEQIGGTGPQLGQIINVTCIGAFSKFPADVISESEQHERFKWLSHLEAQDLIEKAQETPAGQLVIKSEHQGEVGKRMAVRVAMVTTVYHNYRKAFGLDWPDFPLYERTIMDIIHTKREEYDDPKAVEKRLRAAARREGKKAFDEN